MKPWRTVSDVLGVDECAYQTQQACESLQMCGERPMRTCDEPSYVIRTSTPNAIVESGFSPSERTTYSDAPARRLDEREMALLQTFPEEYVFEGDTKNAVRAQIGNAVPPLLVERIAEALR